MDHTYYMGVMSQGDARQLYEIANILNETEQSYLYNGGNLEVHKDDNGNFRLYLSYPGKPSQKMLYATRGAVIGFMRCLGSLHQVKVGKSLQDGKVAEVTEQWVVLSDLEPFINDLPESPVGFVETAKLDTTRSLEVMRTLQEMFNDHGRECVGA